MSSVGMLANLSNPEVCSRFVAALLPNIRFEVSVPNQDCSGRVFPQLEHVCRFESLLSELCGGYAPPVAGTSRYQPQDKAGMNEFTIVLATYLPEHVTEEIGKRLLAAILVFGEEARQQEVLVAVGMFAFRFRFNVSALEEDRNGVVSRTQVA